MVHSRTICDIHMLMYNVVINSITILYIDYICHHIIYILYICLNAALEGFSRRLSPERAALLRHEVGHGGVQLVHGEGEAHLLEHGQRQNYRYNII